MTGAERYERLMSLYDDPMHYLAAVAFGPHRDADLAPADLREALDILWGDPLRALIDERE